MSVYWPSFHAPSVSVGVPSLRGAPPLSGSSCPAPSSCTSLSWTSPRTHCCSHCCWRRRISILTVFWATAKGRDEFRMSEKCKQRNGLWSYLDLELMGAGERSLDFLRCLLLLWRCLLLLCGDLDRRPMVINCDFTKCSLRGIFYQHHWKYNNYDLEVRCHFQSGVAETHYYYYHQLIIWYLFINKDTFT